MDERFVEALLLLPVNSFERGLIAGITDEALINAFRKRVRNVAVTDLARLKNADKNAFDLVLMFSDVPPDPERFQDAIDAANPDGVVVAVMPSRLFGQSNLKYNLPMAMLYGLSPSIEDLRLVLPVENRACAAASLALYQPSLAKAKLRKLLAYWFARFGFSTLWVSWLMCVWYKNRPARKGLRTVLGECFGEDIQLALFTGTPGYLRKPTMQIMDSSGSILGYCKIADSSHTKTVVENEANIIKLVAGMDLGDAITPDVVFSGETADGITVLVQSTKKRHLSSAPLVPEAMHSDFLGRLFKETRVDLRFREAPVYMEVMDRMHGLEGYADNRLLRDLAEAFEWSSGVIDEAEIPLGFAHRDFTPWNTFLVEGRLYVFDWEFGRTKWIPLSDAFHFVLQKGILVDHAAEDSLWEQLIRDGSSQGRFLKKYAALIGIEGDVYNALLAVYLIDMITVYLSHYRGYGRTPIDGEELLTRWNGLLARVMKARDGQLP